MKVPYDVAESFLSRRRAWEILKLLKKIKYGIIPIFEKPLLWPSTIGELMTSIERIWLFQQTMRIDHQILSEDEYREIKRLFEVRFTFEYQYLGIYGVKLTGSRNDLENILMRVIELISDDLDEAVSTGDEFFSLYADYDQRFIGPADITISELLSQFEAAYHQFTASFGVIECSHTFSRRVNLFTSLIEDVDFALSGRGQELTKNRGIVREDLASIDNGLKLVYMFEPSYLGHYRERYQTSESMFPTTPLGENAYRLRQQTIHNIENIVKLKKRNP